MHLSVEGIGFLPLALAGRDVHEVNSLRVGVCQLLPLGLLGSYVSVYVVVDLANVLAAHAHGGEVVADRAAEDCH